MGQLAVDGLDGLEGLAVEGGISLGHETKSCDYGSIALSYGNALTVVRFNTTYSLNLSTGYSLAQLSWSASRRFWSGT